MTPAVSNWRSRVGRLTSHEYHNRIDSTPAGV
jgi:hypothetical protein